MTWSRTKDQHNLINGIIILTRPDFLKNKTRRQEFKSESIQFSLSKIQESFSVLNFFYSIFQSTNQVENPTGLKKQLLYTEMDKQAGCRTYGVFIFFY